MSLGDEKYIALTTFKRDGTPIRTAVWAAPMDDGKIGFWTSSASGKAKRIAHTSKVTIQPCDSPGRLYARAETVFVLSSNRSESVDLP